MDLADLAGILALGAGVDPIEIIGWISHAGQKVLSLRRNRRDARLRLRSRQLARCERNQNTPTLFPQGFQPWVLRLTFDLALFGKRKVLRPHRAVIPL